jgi:hypothetical protein
MTLKLRSALLCSAVCALVFAASSATFAGTIIKLNLGSTGPDVGMNAGGLLSTVSDGNGATTGDQNTAVEFTGFLDGPFADINTSTASFTMSNLGAAGPAQVFGSLVIQNFLGGSFSLYDPSNVLLLSGNLSGSALTGVIGPPGTGGLFTTSLSTVTGGTLQSYINPNSLTLSMNLSTVNGGNGFLVVPPGGPGILQPFLADASVNISGEVPEPTSLVLVMAAFSAALSLRRRG